MEDTAKFPVNIPAREASNPAHEIASEQTTDLQLVRRCQRGELDAYEHLVHRYRHKVFALAYSMVRHEQDATDIAQETFVRAWQGIRHFRRSASFYTWLYRITTNLCIDWLRQRQRRPTEEFDETVQSTPHANVAVAPSSNPSPAREAQRAELREQIDAALLELSPEHRAVIQLREFEGMDYAGIARAVGCSIGTVMSRLHYARRHLQKLLNEEI